MVNCKRCLVYIGWGGSNYCTRCRDELPEAKRTKEIEKHNRYVREREKELRRLKQ